MLKTGLVFVAAVLAFCLETYAMPLTLESVQTFVRELKGTNAANAVLYSPDEAAEIVDTVFKPNCQGVSSLVQLKNLISDGMVLPIGYDVAPERSGDRNAFSAREYLMVPRFYDRETDVHWNSNGKVVEYYPESCARAECIAVRKENGKRIDYPRLEYIEDRFAGILFGADHEVGLDEKVGTNVDVSVVADVETVTLSSASGLDPIIAARGVNRFGDESVKVPLPVGHYRVSLLVRTALDGACSANRLRFTARTEAQNATVDGHWLFYRGMTLKIGLRKTETGYSISRIEPVLPYPPYTTDGVVVCDLGLLRSSRFSMMTQKFKAVDRGGLTVLYGDHTRVDYYSDRKLIEGYCGTLPDFGANVWIYVWTHGAGSNLDYWRNAWFTDSRSRPCAESDSEFEVPLFQKAVMAFAESSEERLRFNWWNLVHPSVAFKPPATMEDVAEFLTTATRPCACTGDVAYRVVADPSVAARPVRPFAVTKIGAYPLLQRLVCENGCKFAIDGTNITLTAELSDTEVATPRVEELESTLAKEGFGSVVGAKYVNMYFWARGIEDDDVNGIVPCGRMNDLESCLDGDGWVRTRVDGTEEFLAFDAVWWDAAKGWRPNGENEDVINFSATPARLRRDILRSLDTLNLLADGAFGWKLDDRQLLIDVKYLLLALHTCQAGWRDEAQQLVDALWRRPAAAQAALAKVCERIGSDKAKCKTVQDWYLMQQAAEKAKKKEEKTAERGENVDEEDDDESDAD